MTCTLGIDPGKTGGLALLSSAGGLIEVATIPLDDEGDYNVEGAHRLVERMRELAHARWLRDPKPEEELVAALEAMGPAGGKLAGSNANYWRGYSAGAWTWLAAGLKLPLVRVHPKKWQNRWKIGGDPAEAVAVAAMIWPNMSWLATKRSRVPHMGLVEAALIAEHVRLSRREEKEK